MLLPRVFRNFYARLSPEWDDRRRRLEKALGLRSSGVLELALNEFEDRLVRSLNDAQREEYFRGELDRELIRTILVIGRRDAEQPRLEIWQSDPPANCAASVKHQPHEERPAR